MKFSEYFASRKNIIFAFILINLFTLCMIFLDRNNRMLTSNILYWAVIVVFLLFTTLFFDYFQQKKIWKELKTGKRKSLSIFNSNDYFGEQKLFIQELKEREDCYSKSSLEYSNRQHENVDLFSGWIHELKTPLAAIRLSQEDIDSELDRFDETLNKALFYLRASTFEKDYMIEKVEMESFVKARIRTMAKLFIGKNMSIRISGNFSEVLSDPKWLGFIVDQILQNAWKYSLNDKAIDIFMIENSLYIKDSGRGIPRDEIPRIFDRGFTGQMWRMDNQSTGLGLFLAKKLSNKMQHKISVKSIEGKGATFILDFPNKNEFLKVLN